MAAVLVTLLSMLGMLAAFQFRTPQEARAEPLTTIPAVAIPVVHGGLIPPNFHIIPNTGRSGEALWRNAVGKFLKPSILDENCTSSRASWVHVYPVDTGIFCLGYSGTWAFNGGNGRWAREVTFGNNYGSIYFQWDGANFFENFDEGYLNFGNPNTALLWTLTINGSH